MAKQGTIGTLLVKMLFKGDPAGAKRAEAQIAKVAKAAQATSLRVQKAAERAAERKAKAEERSAERSVKATERSAERKAKITERAAERSVRATEAAAARKVRVEEAAAARGVAAARAAEKAKAAAAAKGATLAQSITKVNTAFTGMQRLGQQVRSTLLGIGVAIAVVVGGAAIIGSSFEAEIAKVAAISGATVEQLGRIEAKARELGRSTVFTATQAAEAMTEFAKAGASTAEAIAGAGPAMEFAAAAGTDLANSASLMVSTQRQFGLAMSDSAKIGDVFSTAMRSSLLDVEKLQNGMKFAGTAGSSFGMSLEETTAAVAAFADLGLSGTQAGTGLRRALIELAKGSDKTRNGLKRLGLTLKDVNPETNSFGEIIEKLTHTSIDGGTAIEIFGARVGTNIKRLVDATRESAETGGKTILDLTRQLEQSAGATSAMRKAQEDTVRVQAKLVRSAMEDLAISLFGVFKEPLKEVLRTMSAVFNEISAQVAGTSANLERSLGGSVKRLTSSILANKQQIATVFVFIVKSITMISSAVIDLAPVFAGLLATMTAAFAIGKIVVFVSALQGAAAAATATAGAATGLSAALTALSLSGGAAATAMTALTAAGPGLVIGLIAVGVAVVATGLKFREMAKQAEQAKRAEEAYNSVIEKHSEASDANILAMQARAKEAAKQRLLSEESEGLTTREIQGLEALSGAQDAAAVRAAIATGVLVKYNGELKLGSEVLANGTRPIRERINKNNELADSLKGVTGDMDHLRESLVESAGSFDDASVDNIINKSRDLGDAARFAGIDVTALADAHKEAKRVRREDAEAIANVTSELAKADLKQSQAVRIQEAMLKLHDEQVKVQAKVADKLKDTADQTESLTAVLRTNRGAFKQTELAATDMGDGAENGIKKVLKALDDLLAKLRKVAAAAKMDLAKLIGSPEQIETAQFEQAQAIIQATHRATMQGIKEALDAKAIAAEEAARLEIEADQLKRDALAASEQAHQVRLEAIRTKARQVVEDRELAAEKAHRDTLRRIEDADIAADIAAERQRLLGKTVARKSFEQARAVDALKTARAIENIEAASAKRILAIERGLQARLKAIDSDDIEGKLAEREKAAQEIVAIEEDMAAEIGAVRARSKAEDEKASEDWKKGWSDRAKAAIGKINEVMGQVNALLQLVSEAINALRSLGGARATPMSGDTFVASGQARDQQFGGAANAAAAAGDVAVGVGSGAAAGAAAGSLLGPIGTAVGAIVGAVAGAITSLVKLKKAAKEASDAMVSAGLDLIGFSFDLGDIMDEARARIQEDAEKSVDGLRAKLEQDPRLSEENIAAKVQAAIDREVAQGDIGATAAEIITERAEEAVVNAEAMIQAMPDIVDALMNAMPSITQALNKLKPFLMILNEMWTNLFDDAADKASRFAMGFTKSMWKDYKKALKDGNYELAAQIAADANKNADKAQDARDKREGAGHTAAFDGVRYFSAATNVRAHAGEMIVPADQNPFAPKNQVGNAGPAPAGVTGPMRSQSSGPTYVNFDVDGRRIIQSTTDAVEQGRSGRWTSVVRRATGAKKPGIDRGRFNR